MFFDHFEIFDAVEALETVEAKKSADRQTISVDLYILERFRLLSDWNTSEFTLEKQWLKYPFHRLSYDEQTKLMNDNNSGEN